VLIYVNDTRGFLPLCSGKITSIFQVYNGSIPFDLVLIETKLQQKLWYQARSQTQ